MNTEIWKDIEGFEGLYQVSNYGRVKSLEKITYRKRGDGLQIYPMKEHILKPVIKMGYENVCLCKNGTQTQIGVHRLVAKAFPEICGKWFEGCFVNHKDETTRNNHAENLEVCTPIYNYRYGTAIERKNKNLCKKVIQLTTDNSFMKIWDSLKEAIEETKIKNISACCHGKRKTAGGYIWKFA